MVTPATASPVAATAGAASSPLRFGTDRADETADAETERYQAEQPNPFVWHDRQTRGSHSRDGHQRGDACVLAGPDLPSPRATDGAAGQEQHSQHDEVVDVGAGKHADRRSEGSEHMIHERSEYGRWPIGKHDSVARHVSPTAQTVHRSSPPRCPDSRLHLNGRRIGSR